MVDDNPINRQIFMLQLQAWRLRVQTVPGGAEALQALSAALEQGDPYQVAILDLQMPDMDGASLARAIKADPRLQETRLMLISSLGKRGDAKRMAEIGFAAYLLKPTRQSDLYDGLATVLAGSSTSQSAQPILTRFALQERRRASTRILLAEDNLTNQQVAVGLIKKLGLQVDVAGNGAEALHALESSSYDLVLMDIQMPEMDGLEATRRIRDPRSAVRNHQIPIIAMTAHAMHSDREACLEAGTNDYLSKPVSPEALVKALDRWLPRHSGMTKEWLGKPLEPAPAPIKKPAVPVFDGGALMARMMGDDDLVRTVAAGFLEDIPRQIGLLKRHLEGGDSHGMEAQAHSIKGASAQVGGERLRAAALDVEKAGNAGDLKAATKLVPELESQFAQLHQAMTEWFHLPDAGPESTL